MRGLKLGLINNIISSPPSMGGVISTVIALAVESATSEIIKFHLLTEDGNPINLE